MLSADDPLPLRPERVLIAGVTGSGKTTLARRVARLWDLRHVEIDALFHGENWTPRPTFIDDVRAFAAEDRWVTEWQYTSKGTDEILAPRAQIVIWLDYPYRIARRRLLARTLRRRLLRTPLWNGNVEPALWERDGWTGENDILRWQKNTRTKWSERMPRIEATHPHLDVVPLDHPRALEAWLRHVERAPAS
ncbi:AAA family ATPase [Microbacterium foliorum]|uniref:AAA family ATPase n=1 Tax=Microbacterium foliorum TaxID=104336 RepID=UPI001D85718C|nr:AAA family ATPase [Microbacterium foliorum]CAH0239091.1 Shikimate kinase [Microbacterium foliorum]CAH0251791.1 Shikimate kinase [Microbacterium foliorum]